MEGNVVLSNRRCQRRNAHSDVLPRSLSNKDTAASETGNSHVLWIYIQDFSSAATDVFVLLRLYADLCYHLFWSKYVHCSPLFLHSFTPNTQICSHAEAMWACPSACHRFCFVFFSFLMFPFDRWGKERTYAVVSESLWMMWSSSSRDPRGNWRNVAWRGRGEETRRRAVSDGCGWPAFSLILCRSIQPLIWFASLLPSHTNEYRMVGISAVATNAWSSWGCTSLRPVLVKYLVSFKYMGPQR